MNFTFVRCLVELHNGHVTGVTVCTGAVISVRTCVRVVERGRCAIPAEEGSGITGARLAKTTHCVGGIIGRLVYMSICNVDAGTLGVLGERRELLPAALGI